MKRLLIFTAAVCVLAVSCKQESVPAGPSSGTEEIVFTANDSFSAEVSTKTSIITSLESTGFYASASTGTSSETLLWNNASFNYVSGQYKGNRYWPAVNNGIHFYASNSAITFNSNGCSVNGVSAKEKDVVCAYLASPTWGVANELAFEHIFARIGTVTVTAPAGYSVTNLNISFTPSISGNYNIKTKTWSNEAADTSSPSKIIASAASTNDNNLWIIPGTYTLTATYTLEKGTGDGKYSESFTKTANVTLLAGKLNSIQTTLPEGNATEIQFTVSVTPWGNNSITAVFAAS